MRRVVLAGVGAETSCLGFGCASLGSRVSGGEGLRALGRAFDAGVAWFDVAPPYGGGRAELLLGDFVRARRQNVQICTKVGLRAPRRSLAFRTVLPIARKLVAAAPGLRRMARAAPSSRNQSVDLTAKLITSSIAESLTRLKTDHVEVLALHSPPPVVVARDDILVALRQVLDRGQARAVAVAGSVQAALIAAGLGAPYAVLQLEDDPVRSPLAQVRAAFGIQPLGIITHSVFGIDGAFARARERVRLDDARLERLRNLGFQGSAERVVADVLLDRAFSSNPEGVVLASMFEADHLQHNVDRASRPVSSIALTAAQILFD